MVYSLGKVSVYETTPGIETVGGDEAWTRVDYLHPDAVDRHAKGEENHSRRLGYGYPIAPETAPKAMIWKSKSKLPPDYAFGNNEIMLVSRRFHDIVDRFELGVHQFLPVQMYFNRNDADPFGTFYWFVCCTLIDSLDPHLTTIPFRGFYDERMEDGLRRGRWHIDAEADPPQKAVFSLKAIGNHHLWRDPYRARSYVHCSDAFGDAIEGAELKGFGLKHFEQI
ncbi:imm11 family protein [Erythrobacter sp. WG]|uniref:imm11 family protein n=1 Tax=Erythrobacter sp. WG TaxID=2985510 RepID=UPI00226EEB49|nr:DUF1629 domain-containing protein [Erythrobacter sp. WG]MCX9147529.1 hypothetical protein [Erythrobacter sp. WG]